MVKPDAERVCPSGWWSALSSSVERLNPGAFAFVMATGIISLALDRDSMRTASAALLLLGLGGYGVLLVAYGWRLLRWRPRFHADLVSPVGFAFLTIVAASNVLAGRLAADGNKAAAGVLLAVGMVGWLLLGYGIPLALITSTARRPSPDQVNGTWFIWPVATQSGRRRRRRTQPPRSRRRLGRICHGVLGGRARAVFADRWDG